MNQFVELIRSAQKNLSEAESALRELQELGVPKLLEDEVVPIAQKYSVIEKELRAWKIDFFKAVVRLAQTMKVDKLDTEGFIWSHSDPDKIVSRGFIGVASSRRTIDEHVDYYSDSLAPFAFWNALFEKVIARLNERPRGQLREIGELRQLAQKISQINR